MLEEKKNNINFEIFTAFSTTWGKQNVKIVFTIFSTLKFVKNTIGKRTEALGTSIL